MDSSKLHIEPFKNILEFVKLTVKFSVNIYCQYRG